MPKAENWGALARQSAEHVHRSVVADYKRQSEMAMQRIKDLEEQLGVVDAMRAARVSNKPMAVKQTPKCQAVAVALASDWHVEEPVSKESTNGLNHFDLRVADDRIEKFFNAVLRLTEIERNGADIDTCVLFLGGDLMSGYIHEELAETNALSPTETILWVMSRLTRGIALLRKNFKRLLIPCCYGNHGRTTKKPRHATGYQNSYEWLLYKVMSQRAEEGVEWQVADSYFNYVDLFGKTLRFHHGDSLKYQGGIGGLTIPTEKAIASWNKARVADLDCFGHWHTMQQNPKWVSNGSLIGYNAYAIAIKAAYELPQQTYFLFDAKRGRTITAPIILG
jgi:hypothetical protein